jgi:hypothetical protein
MIKVLLRLPVPEGRTGDSVVVSESRAQVLVDSGYAKYLEHVDSNQPEPVTETEASTDAPDVDLPATNAPKAEWVATAEALGLETEDQTKVQLQAAVKDILG